jgi:hypothetical protein
MSSSACAAQAEADLAYVEWAVTIDRDLRKRWLIEVAVLALLLAAPNLQRLVIPPSDTATWDKSYNWPYYLIQAGTLVAPALYMVWQSEEGWQVLGFNRARGLLGLGIDLFEGCACGLTLGMASATLAKLAGSGFQNWDERVSFVSAGLPNVIFLVAMLLATAVALDRLRRALNSRWKAWLLLLAFLCFLPYEQTRYAFEVGWFICMQLILAAYFLLTDRFSPLIVAAITSWATWLVWP